VAETALDSDPAAAPDPAAGFDSEYTVAETSCQPSHRDRCRSLIEQSHDAIYILHDRRFEYINDRFTELFGIKPEEARAHGFDLMSPMAPESRPLIQGRMKRTAAGKEVDSLLNGIARAITARQDLDTILTVVVEQLERHFADLASLWLRDGDSEAFNVAARGARFDDAATELNLPARIVVPSGPGGLRLFLREKLVYMADLVAPHLTVVRHTIEQ
jgi:PAS domain S-box-containing protein